MMNHRFTSSCCLFTLIWCVVSTAEAGVIPDKATVLDANAVFYSWPYPTISPDGSWVAYVSKGRVLVCNVHSPTPRELLEVPNSWTWPKFTVQTGDATRTGSFGEFRGLTREQHRDLLAQVSCTIYGIIWTADSKGFSFGVAVHDAEKKYTVYDGYLAAVDGSLKKIAHFDTETPTRGIVVGKLTSDHEYLVSADIHGKPGVEDPLVWNVTDNKPRATCFDYLAPSPTSDRWIGIEKDTRQLVVVGADFVVVKRFDVFRPERSFGLQLHWSPDERFAIWRNQIGFDHFSNWEGFRMNLETGAKRPLSGRFMDETFQFTGPGGEFYRCGQSGLKTRGYDIVVGAHLSIVPEGDAPEIDLWRLKLGSDELRPGAMTNRPGNPPVHMSPDGQLFAIGLPRKAGERSGFHWHLMDRAGTTWRFPTKDNEEYVSPYDVAGFADNGQVIVGYDSKQLFTVPISTIQADENTLK